MPVDLIKPACTPTPTPVDAVEAVTLRRATPADSAMLALVGAATFLEAFTWMLPGADILAHATTNHTPELPSIPTFATDIELKRIYLFSRFRSAPVVGSGLRPGQALMDAAIADAVALGRTRLLLGTHAGNQRAIAFYRRNGFTEAGTRTFLVGTQQCCDLIFARHL